MHCNVQCKMPCLFQAMVTSEPSKKRPHQSYTVCASDVLLEEAVNNGVASAAISEKIDGTCCYVHLYKDKPCLWARFDRKPNKTADKRYKRFTSPNCPSDGDPEIFTWNLDKDFKDVPKDWIPALGVQLKDGIPQPNFNGHIPGWLPVLVGSRQYCWHNAAIDHDMSIAAVLRECHSAGDEQSLEITLTPLKHLLGTTLELVGTHVNGNPYKLGSKSKPVHLLVEHGSLAYRRQVEMNLNSLKEFFVSGVGGRIEGLVWLCAGGQLYKLHRHHLGLAWPISDPDLALRPVVMNTGVDTDKKIQSNIGRLQSLTGQRFGCVSELNDAMLL